MSGANTFGRLFQVHSFGESHGEALGVTIDGCPAGVKFDFEFLSEELRKRRPGQNQSVSSRNESDTPKVISGVYEGKTLGTPITILVFNEDQRSQDYQNLAPRTGHADDVWKNKFAHSDPRGGGRSSGRETVARVMGGAVAKMYLKTVAPELQIRACSESIGPFTLSLDELTAWKKNPQPENALRYPSQDFSKIESLLQSAKAEGESYGGVVAVVAQHAPKNLGAPVFHKLKADLASAMMSIGATSAFELGEGVLCSTLKGTEFHSAKNPEKYGGIRGGITTGEEIFCRVHFKPTSSILDVAKKGRHDPCIVPRAAAVVESMMALVLADAFLAARTDHV